MFENITKDGIYKIELTKGNPYARYLVVKTYGSKQKRKRMCSMEDIKQQVQEWDDDYSRIEPGFDYRGINVLFSGYTKKKEASRPKKNYYSVYDNKGMLYMQGFGDEIAERFGCKSKTVCNCANTAGRKLTTWINNKKEEFDVCKNGQSEFIWSIDGNINW